MIDYITPTRIKTYLTCPLKFRFSYIENLDSKKLSENRNLLIFDYVHKVISRYLSESNENENAELLKKYLYEIWNKNDFENETDERKIEYEILNLLANFYELYSATGTIRLLNYYFKFNLNNITFAGYIDQMLEKNFNVYYLNFFKIGKMPPDDAEIINDFQILFSIVFLKMQYNILPEKIQVYFLKTNAKKEFQYNPDDIENIKNQLIELTTILSNDDEFKPEKNRYCYSCQFRIICPLFSADSIGAFRKQNELKYKYYKLFEYAKILNTYTFSLKNLVISFNNILEKEDYISDFKYQFLNKEITDKLTEIIPEEKRIIYKIDASADDSEVNIVNIEDGRQAFVYNINLNENIAGNIFIFNKKKFFSDEELTFLNILCSYFNSTFQNAYYYSKSISDDLTKLFNNAYYNYILDKEKKLAAEYEKTLGLIMLDIDYFKKFNDTFGHKTGDLVLVEVAKVLKQSVSLSDYIFRYGGEEFVVIIPNKSLQDVVNIAEKIRVNIANHKVLMNNEKFLSVTVSLGIAVYPDNLDNLDSLFIIADNNLYKSKKNGRNMVSY